MTIRSLDILRDARDRGDLRAVDLAALAALVLRCDESGRCWPSLTTLARDAGMGRTALVGAVGRLTKLGIVSKRAGGPGVSLVYQLGATDPSVKRTTRPGDGRGVVREADGTRPGDGPYLDQELDHWKKTGRTPSESKPKTRRPVSTAGQSEMGHLVTVWSQGREQYGLEPAEPDRKRLASLLRTLGFEATLLRLGNAFRSSRWRSNGCGIGWLFGERGSEYDQAPTWYVPDRIVELMAATKRIHPDSVRKVAAESGADDQASLEKAIDRYKRRISNARPQSRPNDVSGAQCGRTRLPRENA